MGADMGTRVELERQAHRLDPGTSSSGFCRGLCGVATARCVLPNRALFDLPPSPISHPTASPRRAGWLLITSRPASSIVVPYPCCTAPCSGSTRCA